MKSKLRNSAGSVAVTCGVFSLLSFVSTVAQGEAACVSGRIYFASRGEVGRTLSEFGPRLVAVGRVDSVTAKRGVEVLGQFVQPGADDIYQVGDYAAVIDWTTKNSVGRILEVRPVASRYVPGASEIYLKSAVKSADTSQGQLRAGKVVVDYLASSIGVDFASTLQGSVISVFGTQPGPRGVVLGNCVALARTLVKALSSDPLGSLGTGSPDGSLGTGSPDGSLGTGRPDGSLGTGSPDGSLGTGSPDGSLGTGSPDGSLGTGSPDGSLGTGQSGS